MPESYKQVAGKISAASNVLVVLPPLATPDATAAGLALAAFLKRMDKEAPVVSSDGLLNPQASFLPGYSGVLREYSVAKGFVIDVATARTQVSELSYKKEGDRLSIYLKPKSGEFTPGDVTFRTAKFPHDLVVVVGADRLESLGQFYSRNAELFFQAPVVNLDCRGSNTGYGQFNLVDLNASSVSEVAYDLMGEVAREMVDAEVATALLAGIISETNSFQASRTTPQAFQKASQLVALGGRQQDVVNQLYRNKSMGFLKLWGRALARLKVEPAAQMATSAVNQEDVAKSGAGREDVAAILKEMSQQLPFAKVHVFFCGVDSASTEVYVSSPASLGLASVLAEYQPASTLPHAFRMVVPLPLADAEPRVVEAIRKESAKLG